MAENQEQLSTNEKVTVSEETNENDVPEGELLAKSIKCDDCGRVFRTYNTVNFHATKTGHTNFSESTEELRPLTDEEKKQKLDDLKKKLAEKREAERLEEIEKKKESERIRRKRGQELQEAQEKIKEKELLKIADQKRREAIDAKKEKERIRAQIEQDKLERLERQQRLKTPTAPPEAAPKQPVTLATLSSSTSTTCKLQIRIPGSDSLIETFEANDVLSKVYTFLEAKGYSASGSLATTYPRKVFSLDDRTKSLKELGLVPSSVLLYQS